MYLKTQILTVFLHFFLQISMNEVFRDRIFMGDKKVVGKCTHFSIFIFSHTEIIQFELGIIFCHCIFHPASPVDDFRITFAVGIAMQKQMDRKSFFHKDLCIFKNIMGGKPVPFTGYFRMSRYIIGIFPVIMDNDVVHTVYPRTCQNGFSG